MAGIVLSRIAIPTVDAAIGVACEDAFGAGAAREGRTDARASAITKAATVGRLRLRSRSAAAPVVDGGPSAFRARVQPSWRPPFRGERTLGLFAQRASRHESPLSSIRRSRPLSFCHSAFEKPASGIHHLGKRDRHLVGRLHAPSVSATLTTRRSSVDRALHGPCFEAIGQRVIAPSICNSRQARPRWPEPLCGS